MRAVRAAREAEPVAADDDAVLENRRGCRSNALADGHAGVDHAVVADLDLPADHRRAACTTVRAPMRAPSPMTANGPTDTPLAERDVLRRSRAVDARRAAAARDRRRARLRAQTPDKDAASRSIAHEAASADSARMTAEARVERSEAAYLALVKKVRSPGPASSIPATPRMSMSRIAFEPALEARRNVLEFQGPGVSHTDRAVRRRGQVVRTWSIAVRSKKLARCSRLRRTATSCTRCFACGRLESDRAAQLGERRAPFGAPAHDGQPLPRAPHREIVADQPERKVVGDRVGAGYEEEQPEAMNPSAVDGQPEAVLVEIALAAAPRSTFDARSSPMSSG